MSKTGLDPGRQPGKTQIRNKGNIPVIYAPETEKSIDYCSWSELFRYFPGMNGGRLWTPIISLNSWPAYALISAVYAITTDRRSKVRSQKPGYFSPHGKRGILNGLNQLFSTEALCREYCLNPSKLETVRLSFGSTLTEWKGSLSRSWCVDPWTFTTRRSSVRTNPTRREGTAIRRLEYSFERLTV